MQSNIVIKFTDQSESFCNGVEFGLLMDCMERGDDPVQNSKFPVKIDNLEVIRSACAHYGYIPLFGSKYFGEWVDFMGVKKTTSDN